MTEQEIKDRNENICREWVEWHDNEKAVVEPVSALQKRISEKYGIHEDYIYQILRTNTQSLKQDVEYRKLKRLWRLQRLQAGKTTSKKDILDLMEQERKELEGDRPSVENKVTNIMVNVKELSAANLRPEPRTAL